MSPSQIWASQVALVGKNSPANARDLRDMGLIPGWGRSPGLGRSPREGHGNPLQYACLENPMDRGAWWATVHEVAKSWTRLSNWALTRSECVIIWWFAFYDFPQWSLAIKSADIMALGESASTGWTLWLTPQADETQLSWTFCVFPWMVPQSRH